MCNPTAGSPTITLFQLRSNCHIGLESQIIVILNVCFLINIRSLFKKKKILKIMKLYIYNNQSNFQTIQLFERDGRCVQSLICHSP